MGGWGGGMGGMGGGMGGWGGGMGGWGGGMGGACQPGGCSTMYGPVANVCHSAIEHRTVTPVTTVTPIPSRVAPSVAYGTPATAPGGGYGVAGAAGAAPLSFYGAGMGPWGYNVEAGTGWVPGIYTSDVAIEGYI
jgi:hypothetical protein